MNRTMNSFLLPLVFSLIVFVATAEAASLTVSELSPFNALIFGDFVADSSDVEGNAAIGGDLTTTDYSFGAALDSELPSETPVLTVAGAPNMTRTRVYYGDLVHSRTGVITNSGVDGQVRKEETFDFSALQADFLQFSQALAGLPTTGTAAAEFNKLTLLGNPNLSVNVFLITPDLWVDSNGGDVTVIDLDIPDGGTAIINVAGHMPEITALGFDDVVDQQSSPYRRNTIFNLFEAEKVTTQNVGLEGALLAPMANLTHRDGVIYGQVIAGTFQGNGQIDLEPFSGELPVSVPEPGLNVFLVILAMIASGGRRCLVGSR